MDDKFTFKIDDLICDFVTNTICITSDKQYAIQAMESLDDYVFTVYKDGEYFGTFGDMEKFEQVQRSG